MEQQRVHAFTSSPYQYVVDYPGSNDLTRCNSHEANVPKPDHGLFNEKIPFHPFGRETSATRSLSAPVDAFDPWLLEGPPCGSPLSTSSSISHSESVPTPPYTGLPMYDTLEQPFQHIENTPPHHTAWTNESESMWRPDYTEPGPWSGHTYVLPCHDGSSYNYTPVQTVHNYLPPAESSTAPAFLAYEAPPHYPQTQVIDSAPFKKDECVNNAGESSDQDDSESESDYDDDDEDSSQKSSGFSSKGTRAHANVIKHGRWCTSPNLYGNVEARHYSCDLRDINNKARRCDKKFVRPEHLRRHMKTVHGTVKLYVCKVPHCERPFSRGDNLRDHYWTHLNRGGRVGRNIKMEFQELKEILGPRERKLARRLKLKLMNKQRAIQARAML